MRRRNPQGFASLPRIEWDFVVDISCEKAGILLPSKNYFQWDFPDPLDGPIELYETLFRNLNEHIRDLFRGIEVGLDAS